jgi:quinohemoprotein ethanol dehydrogenase
MKIVTRFTCGVVVMTALLPLVGLKGQQTLSPGSTGSQTERDSTQWLNTGGDFAETRYSALKEINAGTVGQLGLAWYCDTDSEPGALEATPILADGVLYTTLTWDVVLAVDARTGKLKWRYDPHIPHHNFAPGTVGKPNAVRIGPTIAVDSNRGAGFYDGKVYVGLLDGRLIALDAATGHLAWEVHASSKAR